MIKSKTDYIYYLTQDRIALGLPSQSTFLFKIKQLIWPDPTYQFEILLRKVEWLTYRREKNKSKLLLFRWLLAKYKFKNTSIKLGFSIPINVFGPGLSIPHYGTIVVNPNVKVGANCRLHVGVNIGASGGADHVPTIGDNVYIGPGAIIFGNITIGNNVSIGANSTVTKSFGNNVVIAGSPAKIIKSNEDNGNS